MHILIPYASVHGSTTEIAAFIARILEQHYPTTLAHVDAVDDIRQYDVLMPGAPIHTGMWVEPMLRFIHEHNAALQEKIVFPWLACVRILEQGGPEHVMQHYFPPEILKLPRLMSVGTFAGRLEAAQIDYDERWRYALHYDGGNMVDWMHGDFRDWSKIRAWTEQVVQQLNSLSRVHV